MTDRTTDEPIPKVTRARAVTVGAADPATPRPRASRTTTATAEARTAGGANEALPASPPVSDVPATIDPDTVLADVVTVREGGIGTARARAIEVQGGAIGTAEATDIAVSQGAIGIARGGKVSVEMGALGIAIADQARVSQGAAQAIIAREATFEQGVLGTVVAGRLTVRQPSFVGIILAGRVDGEVRTLLDWRGALAVGAVISLVVGVLRRR